MKRQHPEYNNQIMNTDDVSHGHTHTDPVRVLGLFGTSGLEPLVIRLLFPVIMSQVLFVSIAGVVSIKTL